MSCGRLYSSPLFNGFSETKLMVKHNGDVMYRIAGIISAMAELDYTLYPYDSQTIILFIGPWLHDPTEIVIYLND